VPQTAGLAVPLLLLLLLASPLIPLPALPLSH
jgi:hypothetical protein